MKDKDDKTTLLFDLDDTLIENAAHFLEVKNNVAKQIEKLNPHLNLNISKIIQGFDNKEVENSRSGHGFGYENFRISLLEQCYSFLGYDFFKHKLYQFVDREIAWLKERPIEVIVGVYETLSRLKEKGYRIMVITKGKTEEQRSKLRGLEIAGHLDSIETMEDKKPQSYLKIVKKYDLKVENCYMIGNSPKSDINNAKEVGLRTILIPNPNTWKYENESISPKEPKTIVLKSFSDLLSLF